MKLNIFYSLYIYRCHGMKISPGGKVKGWEGITLISNQVYGENTKIGKSPSPLLLSIRGPDHLYDTKGNTREKK